VNTVFGDVIPVAPIARQNAEANLKHEGDGALFLRALREMHEGLLRDVPVGPVVRLNGELTAKVARLEELLASTRSQCEHYLQQRIELENKLEAIAAVIRR